MAPSDVFTRGIDIAGALMATSSTAAFFTNLGTSLAMIGVVIGLAASVALARLMSTMLFEVSAIDPATYGAVAVSLLAVAALASYLPALRITAIDPVEALRSE